MTAACSDRPHFAPTGCDTAREPGTTMASSRSEERRVGKECRSRWAADDQKKKTRSDEPARGGDRHERSEHAVQHQRDVGLEEDEPRKPDPTDYDRRRHKVRRHRDIVEEADLH